jgi:hypothetical protein
MITKFFLHIQSFTKGAWKWFLVFKFLFNNRGNETFGADEVIGAVNFSITMRKCSLEAQENAFQFVKNLLDLACSNKSNAKLIRIGPVNDSGYYSVVPKPNSILIAGGAGKNIDFETFFAKKGVSVKIFDPTVAILPSSHTKIEHFSVALDIGNKYFKNSMSFNEIMKKFEVEMFESNERFLKLDIEGSELAFLGSEILDLSQFDQIIIEIHNLSYILRDNYLKKFELMFDNLFRHHFLANMNANNNGILFSLGDKSFPEVIELTLLNKRYFNSHGVLNNSNLISTNNQNRFPININNIIDSWKVL